MECKYAMFRGEMCKVGRIVNSNVCIETKKGIRFVHISRLQFLEENKPELEDMTKAQLIDYANGKDIPIDPRAKKADIIDVIRNI